MCTRRCIPISLAPFANLSGGTLRNGGIGSAMRRRSFCDNARVIARCVQRERTREGVLLFFFLLPETDETYGNRA